jgi:predicted DsbA family dithiol-disulfide isomerase
MPDKDLQNAIKNDKESHPKCGYSSSLKQACSNKNGKFECETIQQAFRLCPNEKPVEVYRETSMKDNEDQDLFGSLGAFGSFFGGKVNIDEDDRSPSPFAEELSAIEKTLFSSLFGKDSLKPPFQTEEDENDDDVDENEAESHGSENSDSKFSLDDNIFPDGESNDH